MEPPRKWSLVNIVLTAVLVFCLASDCAAEFVHVRDISTLCGRKPPAPFIVGGAAASLLLRRRPGDWEKKCFVVQQVVTDAGHIRNGARLYTKVISMAIQENREGACYHSLTVEELDGFHAELCGPLTNLAQDEFVSEGNEITVTWDLRNTSDAELTTQSYEKSTFKLVITAFEDLDPKTGECPTSGHNSHPETVIAWHKCTNQRCIDARLQCNGFNNCGDPEGSDELNCPDPDDDMNMLPIILGIVFGGLTLIVLIGYGLYRVGASEDDDELQK